MLRKKENWNERLDLIEHKLDIINIKLDKIIKEQPKKSDKNYALDGVPEYQLNYINDILEADKN